MSEDRPLSREERIEIFDEEHVEHTEWWAQEMDRVKSVVAALVDAVGDRDDVQLAKRGRSVGRNGEHTATLELRIAGEPYEHEGEEVRLYRCGGCETVYEEPWIDETGPYETGYCPHCGTETSHEDTEVRDVVF